jgi:hypothetical protein
MDCIKLESVASPISTNMLFSIFSYFLDILLISNPKIHFEFLNVSLNALILPPPKTPISKYFIGLSLKSFNNVLYLMYFQENYLMYVQYNDLGT